jgi:hypothetical protein
VKIAIFNCGFGSTIAIFMLALTTLGIPPVHGFHLAWLPFVAPTANCYQDSNWYGHCEVVIYHIPPETTYWIGTGIYLDDSPPPWRTCVQPLKGTARNNSYTIPCSFDFHGIQLNQYHRLSSEFVICLVTNGVTNGDQWNYIQSVNVFSIPLTFYVS